MGCEGRILGLPGGHLEEVSSTKTSEIFNLDV